MTAVDWKWLNAMATGMPQTAMPKACQKKLAELSYIVARFHDLSFAITGLGQEALRRRRFNLGPPESGIEDAAEETAKLPDASEEEEAADALE